MDGQFCVVSHDARNGDTLVATDRFGAAPVYVARDGGLLLASTSALALAHHLQAEPDPDALLDFLVSGYQFGPRTHWRGVRRLEPGDCLVVRPASATDAASGPARTEEVTWWRPEVMPEVERMDLDQAATHVLDVAVSTLRERLGDTETWLDLTGGYDSRLLAMLLDRAGVPFRAQTRSGIASLSPQAQRALLPDTAYASDLARRAGWPWEDAPLPTDWPTAQHDVLHPALANSDGRLEVLQLSRVVWPHQRLADSLPHLLSGGGGEHLQYAPWKIELPFPGRRRVNIHRWVDMIALRPTDLDILLPGAREQTLDRHVAAYERFVAPYDDEPSTRILDACFAYKGSSHFGAYRAVDEVDLDAQLPYFFEPIFSATFSLDHRVRAGFRLMREMMWRLNPELASLPTTRGGPAAPMRLSTALGYAPYYGQLVRKGVNKIGYKATGRVPLPFAEHSTWPRAAANRSAIEHLREVGSLDWDDLRIAPLLTQPGVERLRDLEVDDAMLGRVVTAELALAATGARL